MVVGKSKTGKSSATLMIAGKNLESLKENGTGPMCINSTDPNVSKYIGTGNEAKTKLPNLFDVINEKTKKKYFYIDCPGLQDSEGF